MRKHLFVVLVVVSVIVAAAPGSAQVLKETAVLSAEDDAAITDLAMDGEGRWLTAYSYRPGKNRSALRFWNLKSRKQLDPPKDAIKADVDKDKLGRIGGGPRSPMRMSIHSGFLVFATDQGFGLRRFQAEPEQITVFSDISTGRHLIVNSIQVSEDGQRVLIGGQKTSVIGTSDGQSIASFETNYGSCRASPDFGTIAVAASQDVDLYDVATKKVRASFLDHRGAVASLAFSADGKILVVASTRGDSEERHFANVKLWDVSSGNEIQSLPERTNPVSGLWIDETANRILLATNTDGLYWRQAGLQIFDRAIGNWTAIDCKNAKGHDPRCLAADSSLSMVVAGFTDGTIHLYDVRGPAKK